MFLDRIPVRFRLSLGHALWMGILFAGVGVGLYRVVEHNLYQSVDAALLTSARSVRDARFIRGFSSPLLESFLDRFLGERFVRPYAQLVDLSGNISAKTPNVRVSLPVTPKAVRNAELGRQTYETFHRAGHAPLRQLTLPIVGRGGRFTGELIQIGAPLDSTQHTLNNIKLVLWAALPLGLFVSIFFGYLLTARSLRPVRRISQAASQLGSDDLAVRLPVPRAKDELQVMTKAFNRMLDRLDDAFGRLRRFTGDVSHELRTPLAVLRGEAELALRKKRTAAEYETALQTIVKETDHMTHIIDDLLLLARAQSGAVVMNGEPFPAAEFITNLKTSVESLYRGREVYIHVEDRCTKPIFGSPNYLSLALRNILVNAVKHTPDGRVVTIRVWQTMTETHFQIQDSGEGIPAESLPYIFDPFYRADTARNRKAGGSGIGLSLALALIKLHNGSLSAESEEGQGATFLVSIPLDAETPITLVETAKKKGSPAWRLPAKVQEVPT